MNSIGTYRQPWIKSAAYDGAFILMPPFVALLIVLLLPAEYRNTTAMPLAGWVILVLFIDVAHVYSTLFNTYLNRDRFARQRRLFIIAPIACYAVGVVLYLFGGLVFWRVLAYVAVFHFVRQQYGFMRLYSRYEAKKTLSASIDTLAIYAASLYPILYWHCSPGRNFNWFVEGDFIIFNGANINLVGFVFYGGIMLAFITKEVLTTMKGNRPNLPKVAIIAGTAISWYCGIVLFNGDMAFTLLNVVAHGLPYVALVWMGRRQPSEQPSSIKSTISLSNAGKYGLLVFVFSLVLLAYLEEGLWDGLVWSDHSSVFPLFSELPTIDSNLLLAFVVPLLSLPQTTHYVLDGFIWRRGFE